MAMVLAPRFGADASRTTQMLLLHDLGEAVTGDIVTVRVKNGVEEELPNRTKKLHDERKALVDILHLVDTEHLIELYDEFNNNKTPEAKLANALDGLEMGIQAREYETAENIDLHDFYVSVERRIREHPLSQLLPILINFRTQQD